MQDRIEQIRAELDLLMSLEIKLIREQSSTVIIDLRVLSLRRELVALSNQAWRG